jgi:uncharacterized membrane protein (DUF4010 family)
MALPDLEWPYPLTLSRLLLALAIGLFVGLERERRGKESGLRTFGFVALLGCLGGLLGDAYALTSLFFLIVLVVLLNLQTLRANQGTELTTSAALMLTGMTGILCGQGHTFTPLAVSVATAALLAWKERLAGFSTHLSESELRSAILLAILAFVIYPALPAGSIDPWQVLIPREALITVILIAGIGFVNYILWKMYGERGIELTGFLGGLVNSTVAVGELAARVKESGGQLVTVAYRGSLLATAAMVVRNSVILALLAPKALSTAILPHLCMLLACGGLLLFSQPTPTQSGAGMPQLHFESPFSLKAALRYGGVFLLLQVAAVLAQQNFGQLGVYVTSFFGGLVSSASAVAAAASLSSQGSIASATAGGSAVIASLTSALINLPLIFRAHQQQLTQRFILATGMVIIFGILGLVLQLYFGLYVWARV